MRRGDLYRVAHPSRTDPRRSRVFVAVSRQVPCDIPEYDTVICAPVSSSRHGLGTQVTIGESEGFKHARAIHCDGLVSVPESARPDYGGCRGPQKFAALYVSLTVALARLE